ncbi:hypothetical protein ACROYT_G005374 [Oculina patagonica]
MKGSRIVIPKSMRPGILSRLHDAHKGLTSTLQRARRTVYCPKIQDDISEMVQKCNEFQRHGNKKPRPPERQISATHPMEILGMILKKSTSDIDITKALTTYLDTPVSNNLPSPAELFYSRPINTRLSVAMTPALLTDQQKSQLSEKRSAHLEPIKQDNYIYLPGQPIWFTDDDSDEWKPGYIESKDTSPDLYWIINDKTNRHRRTGTVGPGGAETLLPEKNGMGLKPNKQPYEMDNKTCVEIVVYKPCQLA